jgi:hypothetical protein
MNGTTIKIASTFNVEKPLSESQWLKKYKIGSRVPKFQKDLDMYHRGEYDKQKLFAMIKQGNKKPSLYDRIWKAITA